MTNYNFMSGSTIDNATLFAFDALLSGQSYLGFSKGTPEMQWGINTLILVEPSSANEFPTYVASNANGATTESSLFFDLNSLKDVVGSSDEKRIVKIGYVLNSDPNFEAVTYPLGLGTLKLSYIGKNWVSIQGLDKYYYNTLTQSTVSGSYYLFNYNSASGIPLKILKKSIAAVPYFSSNCSIWYQAVSGGEYILAADGLQRTINMLGEVYVSGLVAPEELPNDSVFNDLVDGILHKNTLKTAYNFILRDESGNILMDNLQFQDINEDSTTEIYTEVQSLGSGQKYLTFMYGYINDEPQYIKFIIGANGIDELAIWCETLPYDSTVPTSDSNPPALDITYLKNPVFSSSIFDMNGLIKIQTADVSFVKEVNNLTEQQYFLDNGFTIETLTLHGSPTTHIAIVKTQVVNGDNTFNVYNNANFAVNDKIFIPFIINDTSLNPSGLTYTVSAVDYTDGNNTITVTPALSLVLPIPANYILESDPSDVNAIITLATTTDKDKALKYGMYNAMITKEVDLTGANSPTEGIYRQLSICYKPKTDAGVLCTDDVYNGDASLFGANFNLTDWVYDSGLILYTANKVPIYRKWANSNEQFKIII